MASAAELRARGNELFSQHQYAEAVTAYTAAIEALQAPQEGEQPATTAETLGALYSNRSACNVHLKAYESAFNDAERCVTRRPKWAKGYARKATALMQLKRFADATTALDKGLVLEPKNPQFQTTRTRLGWLQKAVIKPPKQPLPSLPPPRIRASPGNPAPSLGEQRKQIRTLARENAPWLLEVMRPCSGTPHDASNPSSVTHRIQTMEKGTTLYVLAADWWVQWSKSVGFYPIDSPTEKGEAKGEGVVEGQATKEEAKEEKKEKTDDAEGVEERRGDTIGEDEVKVEVDTEEVKDKEEEEEKKPIDCIDNDSVLNGGTRDYTANPELTLRWGVRENVDFVYLTKAIWKCFMDWYGGGPCLERSIYRGGMTRAVNSVNLFPAHLKVSGWGKDSETKEDRTQQQWVLVSLESTVRELTNLLGMRFYPSPPHLSQLCLPEPPITFLETGDRLKTLQSMGIRHGMAVLVITGDSPAQGQEKGGIPGLRGWQGGGAGKAKLPPIPAPPTPAITELPEEGSSGDTPVAASSTEE